MIVLGNRLLVSKIEEEKKDGFQTIEVQDSFLYRGKVEQIGASVQAMSKAGFSTDPDPNCAIAVGATVLFAKYSPHTQTVFVSGQEMKVIRMEDVIAVE